jgi:hypothetical protein
MLGKKARCKTCSATFLIQPKLAPVMLAELPPRQCAPEPVPVVNTAADDSGQDETDEGVDPGRRADKPDRVVHRVWPLADPPRRRRPRALALGLVLAATTLGLSLIVASIVLWAGRSRALTPSEILTAPDPLLDQIVVVQGVVLGAPLDIGLTDFSGRRIFSVALIDSDKLLSSASLHQPAAHDHRVPAAELPVRLGAGYGTAFATICEAEEAGKPFLGVHNQIGSGTSIYLEHCEVLDVRR